MVQRYFPSPEDLFRYFRLKSLVLVLSMAAISTISAQGVQTDPNIGDLTSVKWKTTVDATAQLDLEKTKTAQTLASSSLHHTDVALYKSYDKLLDYLKVSVQANQPLDDAIAKNVQKVLTEAPNDPVMKNMQPEGLYLLTHFLIEQLEEQQIPKIGQ